MRGSGFTGPVRANPPNVTNRRGGFLANFANRGSPPMRETNVKGGAVPNFRTVTNIKGGAVPQFKSKGISAFAPSELSAAAQYGRMINQGQAGGMKSISPDARAMSYTNPLERIRAQLFDNRQDVSLNRLQRRLDQRNANLLDKFTMFKPVQGSSNLLQSVTPGGPSIAETQAERARQFGPTFKELMSDINFAAGQIGQGLAEKGTPLMNLMKSIYGGVQNFFTGASQAPTMDEFASYKQGLNPSQLAIFNFRINAGNSPEFAREAALAGVPMAQGGVVNL